MSQTDTSLRRLQLQTVDILYLHAPDHKNSLQETLRAMNDLHKQGRFQRFGLSNYAAWQVADIVHICRREGYVMPTVYQGMYNALTRSVEDELFPCLRANNIVFYAYNPLAGGILTGRYRVDDAKKTDITPGRFHGNTWAAAYQQRYWKDSYFQALDGIQTALTEAYGDTVPMAEAAIRWLMHHSEMTAGDALIVGASSQGHLTQNLASCKKEPLADAVVQAFQHGAVLTKGNCPKYFR